MENENIELMNFSLSPKQFKYKKILDKNFIEAEIWAISDINPNRNDSHFTLESLYLAKDHVKNTPILGFFDGKDFNSHEGYTDYDSELDKAFWNTEKGERILGWVRESDNVEIVEKDGLHWLKFTCVLCVTYCYRQIKRLLKDKRKKVSVEIQVLQKEVVGKITHIKEFALNGVAILGSKNGVAVVEGIPDAHLSVLEEIDKEDMENQKKMLTFAYDKFDKRADQNSAEELEMSCDAEKKSIKEEDGEMSMEQLCDKNDLLYAEKITVDKSKDAMSYDAWGDIDKGALKKKVVEAENFKEVAKDIFLQLEDGWEDGEVTKLKYPVMQLDGNKAVYNRYALSSAKAYAEQHGEEEVSKKVDKIYEDLGLDEEDSEKEELQMDNECKEMAAEEQMCGEPEVQECHSAEEAGAEHCDCGCEDCGHDEDGEGEDKENECDGDKCEAAPECEAAEVETGLPQCEEIVSEGEESAAVIVDEKAPEALIPEGGITAEIANDEGKATVDIVADGNDENNDTKTVAAEVEDLGVKCRCLEDKCAEKDAEIAALKERLDRMCDYEEIKAELCECQKTIHGYVCEKMCNIAMSLMDQENIEKKYCDEIIANCKDGKYSCEDDIKKDVAVAIYSSRPQQAKRREFSVSVVPGNGAAAEKVEKRKATPHEILQNYIK